MCLYRNTCCAYINLYTCYIKKIEIVEKDNGQHYKFTKYICVLL